MIFLLFFLVDWLYVFHYFYLIRFVAINWSDLSSFGCSILFDSLLILWITRRKKKLELCLDGLEKYLSR
jgi:hypothetical protein